MILPESEAILAVLVAIRPDAESILFSAIETRPESEAIVLLVSTMLPERFAEIFCSTRSILPERVEIVPERAFCALESVK
jgi:hypothetical protein